MKTKLFSIEVSDEAEIDFDKSCEYYYEDSPKVADALFKRINNTRDYNISYEQKS